jgi:hypothetical protein
MGRVHWRNLSREKDEYDYYYYKDLISIFQVPFFSYSVPLFFGGMWHLWHGGGLCGWVWLVGASVCADGFLFSFFFPVHIYSILLFFLLLQLVRVFSFSLLSSSYLQLLIWLGVLIFPIVCPFPVHPHWVSSRSGLHSLRHSTHFTPEKRKKKTQDPTNTHTQNTIGDPIVIPRRVKIRKRNAPPWVNSNQSSAQLPEFCFLFTFYPGSQQTTPIIIRLAYLCLPVNDFMSCCCRVSFVVLFFF